MIIVIGLSHYSRNECRNKTKAQRYFGKKYFQQFEKHETVEKKKYSTAENRTVCYLCGFSGSVLNSQS